ncbi:MAG TPA: DUF1292 domain-containing protein [Symbiobacteriaceae bacterium]|nr:DUF1292 domain-containing protein [Symbiobacteriaceae bacterium]
MSQNPQADVIVTLVDEEGNEREFAIVGELKIAGKSYALLQARVVIEGEEEAPPLMVLGVEADPADEKADLLVDIEADEEFERVMIAAEAAVAGLDYCRVCGCTDANGCEGGCIWAAPGLCSRCAMAAHKALQEAGRSLASSLALRYGVLSYAEAVVLVNLVHGDDNQATAAVERIHRGENWTAVYHELAKRAVLAVPEGSVQGNG